MFYVVATSLPCSPVWGAPRQATAVLFALFGCPAVCLDLLIIVAVTNFNKDVKNVRVLKIGTLRNEHHRIPIPQGAKDRLNTGHNGMIFLGVSVGK